MTSAAASSFPTSAETADKFATNSESDARTAIQLAQLLRTANLSNWRGAQADIQLSPTSCIDVYKSLVLQKSPLTLMPAVADGNPDPTRSAKNLATRHQAGKLALRCRKLEIETSAASQPIQYQLYLACGFALYEVNGITRRMPILLIPVSIGRQRGRGSAYTLSYQPGSLLRLNPQVAEVCDTHVEQLVKPMRRTSDLRDYLRSIKQKLHKNLGCRVSANTGIMSLQQGVLGEFSKEEIIDIELDRTKPGTEFTPLPATPNAFNAQLAIRILRFVKEEQLSSALHNFSGAKNKPVQPILDAEPDLDDATLEKYYNCASWLVDVGLGHWQLKNIARLPARVDQMLANINTLLADDGLQRHIRPEFRTIDLLYRLSLSKDKIINSPNEMLHHASSQHAEADTRLLLQKAKIQASSLEHELAVIHETFHMNAVPDSKTLHKLVKTIAKREEETQLTNPNYFRARRRLNEILQTHNGVITDNDLQRLEKLSKTLKFAELFNEDPYYKRCFGSLFKGIDTNWQRLDSAVNYTRSLTHDLGSALLVAQFTDQWTSFQRDFTAFAPQLDLAASSAHKLCALIPAFINHSTRLEHATRTGEKFSQRVSLWHSYLQKNFADSELTPFQLLSNVELSDHTHPQITLSQLEFDERIYQHIVGSGLTPETISATSEWLLNVVERLQIDIASVRRFLDKEAELASQLSAA